MHVFTPWTVTDSRVTLSAASEWDAVREPPAGTVVDVVADVFAEFQHAYLDNSTYIVSKHVVRGDVFNIIDSRPDLRFIFTTKHPGNVRAIWPVVMESRDDVCDDDGQTYSLHRPNVALFLAATTQAELDSGAADLLACDDLVAKIGIDLRGQTERMDLGDLFGTCYHDADDESGTTGDVPYNHGIDLIRTGGTDSPVHPDWIRETRDACISAGVGFVDNGELEW